MCSRCRKLGTSDNTTCHEPFHGMGSSMRMVVCCWLAALDDQVWVLEFASGFPACTSGSAIVEGSPR